MRKIILSAILLTPFLLKAQDKTNEANFGIKFTGFVKTDMFYDTRQTVNIREGHFLLYPDDKMLDNNNNDINEKTNFNILSIQTRLKGIITGPDAFGAKTTGVIEADFFGNAGTGLDDVNGFRLRHAFVKMTWKKAEILAGQYWHPIFIAESFPGVISFNTGAPFQPFSRNPQLRFTRKFNTLSLVATAFSQRDFQSTGPDGSSTKYLRNAGIPDLNLQIQFQPKSTEHLLGLGVDYKVLVPRLYSEVTVTKAKTLVDTTTWTVKQIPAVTAKYKVDEKVPGISVFGFGKLKFKPLTVKFEGVYAENATDLTMIGGYAAKDVVNATTGEMNYSALKTSSFWTDITTNGKNIQAALFLGYSKNMGSNDSIKGTIYARGSNIDYLYRVAPRVVFISGKLNISLEAEYTFAMYGTANGDSKGGITNGRAVADMRGLLAFIYNF